MKNDRLWQVIDRKLKIILVSGLLFSCPPVLSLIQMCGMGRLETEHLSFVKTSSCQIFLWKSLYIDIR